MNGWQRLYVLFAVIVLAGAFVIAWFERPSGGDVQPVYSCGLNDYLVAPERAARYLADGRVPASDTYLTTDSPNYDKKQCGADLRLVAQRAMYGHRLKAHWNGATEVVPWLLGFLGLVYAFGWAIGWVWRGFFPARSRGGA